MSKLSISSAVLALLCAPLAFAQTEAPPAHVAVLDGDVVLARDAQSVEAIVNMPIVPGDRLMTSAGRVEVLFPDGAALDLDERTTADFSADGRIRLSSGRAILTVPNVSIALRYEISTPSGSVVTRGPGKYRADASSVSAWALSTRTNTNDGFEGWSDALRAARTATTASPSSGYLPEELQTYDTTLDQNGTWQYAPTYGYVWYPRVDSDWRPYYEGTWTTVPSYGWTWIGAHRWEYPTHHYGRWGYGGNRWFWIPGRAYSPAWVAWGYASDYVSWCPLGIDSRPVFAMTVGYGNPWTGWTVLSKSHFGGRGYVPRLAVPGHQVPSQTPFVVQNAAPSIAVPRGDVYGVRPGGTAVPRQSPVPSPQSPVPSAQSPVGSPQPPTVTPYQPRPTTDDRRPTTDDRRPGTAVPRGDRRAPSAPANPGDNPAYAPRYAPAPSSTPRQPATPATPATSTPSATPPSTPPTAGAPHSAPPAPRTSSTPGTTTSSTPPAAAAPRSTPPPKSGDKPAKPAEAKPKGRGGL